MRSPALSQAEASSIHDDKTVAPPTSFVPAFGEDSLDISWLALRSIAISPRSPVIATPKSSQILPCVNTPETAII
jgi:hypothetical protein